MSQVVAVVADLIFQSRLQAEAKAAGVQLVTARRAEDVQFAVGPETRLVLVDMGLPGTNAIDAIAAARGASSSVRIIAFYAHVEAERADAARAAGADEAIPRSAFSQRLPALLAQYRTDNP